MKLGKKEHAKKLLDVEITVSHAAMLSEGMSYANNGMTDKLYANMATGAFGILGVALDKAYEDISEVNLKLVRKKGLQHTLDGKGGASNG